MNWIKKTLSKIKEPDYTPAPIDNIKDSLSDTPQTCSKPITTHKKRLPPDTLKKFVPLRDLDELSIDLIPHTIQVFAKNSTLFIRGQSTDEVYYLLEGTVNIRPDSTTDYEISCDETRARFPLNSGEMYGATATTKTEVTLIVLSNDLNRLWSDKCDNEVSCVELQTIELPKELNDHHFFNSFAQAFRDNQLSLPSLPNIAFKLKDAIENDIGVNEAVEIIHLDTPIVTKLIQVANSPIYASVNPITNCHDAVNRLGLNATRNLVMSISLKQLFHCKDKQLMKGMQNLWQKSLYISSLSFVLAAESGTINPEDALLAGLVADIGSIPLLHFAEQNPSEDTEFKDLESALPYLRAPVGTLVLHTLGFSEELTAIPHHAEDWFYDSGKELTLTDIVILAKLHSFISTKNTKDLPYINSIPAYNKLKEGKLNPDFSLQVLHKAQERINNAMRMIS